MSTFVLLHGAGSDAWYWHLVGPELEAAGHAVVAVDLPVDDDAAGLAEYVDAAVDAIGDRADAAGGLVVVAQSLGGLVAPLLCDRVPVRLLVLVAAMVPTPGEPPGDWWANTGHDATLFEQDEATMFLHDLPPDLAAEASAHARPQSGTPFEAPWPRAAWPDVPTRFLLATNDRLFPPDFQRRVVADRLGIVPDEIDTGHLPALARPVELAARLLAYADEAETGR